MLKKLLRILGADHLKAGSTPMALVLFTWVNSAIALDFGDAPDSYGTTLVADGARHVISSNLFIGTSPGDDETDAVFPLDGTGDDSLAADDEDAGMTLALGSPGYPYPTLTAGAVSYHVPGVVAHNTSGVDATLHAWIDFDRDGKFQVDEYTATNVANGSASILNALHNLDWALLPADITAGSTYIRLRLTTQSLMDNTSTPEVDERSLGLAGDGEIEDHSYEIVVPVDLSCTTDTITGVYSENADATKAGLSEVRSINTTTGNSIGLFSTTGFRSPAIAQTPDGRRIFYIRESFENGEFLFNLIMFDGSTHTDLGQTQASVKMAIDASGVGYLLTDPAPVASPGLELFRFDANAVLPVLIPVGQISDANLIDPSVQDDANGDIAIDANGVIWFVNGTAGLWTIDPGNLVGTYRGQVTGIPTSIFLAGMTFDAAGLLYLSGASSEAVEVLFSVTVTGSEQSWPATQLGPSTPNYFAGYLDLGSCANPASPFTMENGQLSAVPGLDRKVLVLLLGLVLLFGMMGLRR